jgi:hypothetical protein
MKKHRIRYLYFCFILFYFITGNAFAQDIEIHYGATAIYHPPGIEELVFDIEVVNISAMEQTVFMVRTINDLPAGLGWTSSLCFGDVCAAPFVDSLATTGDPLPPPLQSQDTLDASVHVFIQNNVGTANIQVQIGTFRNPGIRETIDFIATTDPSVDVEDEIKFNSFKLEQNYPNPFNPSTQIQYGVAQAGFVSLKVYNILGKEVAELVNEYKAAGSYEINFNSTGLSSGIYIYRLVSGMFSETRKMILEK